MRSFDPFEIRNSHYLVPQMETRERSNRKKENNRKRQHEYMEDPDHRAKKNQYMRDYRKEHAEYVESLEKRLSYVEPRLAFFEHEYNQLKVKECSIYYSF